MGTNVRRSPECNIHICLHHLDKDSLLLALKKGESRWLWGREREESGGGWRIWKGIKKPIYKSISLRQSLYIYIYILQK